MEETVIHIISEITSISHEELKENQNKENMWESFSAIEIVIALEEEFDIMFSQEEIKEMKTIADIIRIIESKK